jgi:hypothetical protein
MNSGNSNSNEHMGQIASNIASNVVSNIVQNVPNFSKDQIPSTCGTVVKSSPISNNDVRVYNDVYSNVNDVIPKHDVSSRTVGCPVQQMNDATDKYIRDIVLGGKFLCNSQGVSGKATDEEILDYQDSFFGFVNKINNSSNGGVDTVDKLAEHFTGSEALRYTGQQISDVFKELTRNTSTNNECNKQMSMDNLVEPQIDDVLKVALYADEDAKFYKNYDWKYKTDNVNNGGKFYDNIEAADYDADYHMIFKNSSKSEEKQ